MGEFTTEFVYNSTDIPNPIKIQIDLPFTENTEEVVQTLILNNGLPVFKDKGKTVVFVKLVYIIVIV